MRKLCLFAGGFALAAAAYVYGRHDALLLALAAAALLLSLAARHWRLRRASIALLGAAVGVAWCFFYQQTILGPANRAVGQTAVCEARVSGQPEPTQYGWKAEVQLTLEGRRFGAVLYGDDTLSEAALGDTVTGRCTVERTGVDFQGGERLSLRASGTFLILSAQETLTVTPGQPTWYARLRLWLQGRIEALFSGEAASFLRALVTGDQSGFSYQTQNDLAVAGLSHAVAVSGMHVSILIACLSFLFRGNPRLTAWVGVPLAAAFAVMTGASPSACRAAVMQVFLLLAPLCRREYDMPTALAAAGLGLTVQNPWAIASVSFQLSFAAVAGLYCLSGPIRQWLVKRRAPDSLAAALSTTLAATAFTLPLSLLYFRTVSLVAPLTNLLCLWAVTGCFVLGIAACLIVPLGPLLAAPAGWLAEGILWLCRTLSRFPYAAAYVQNPALLVWAVAAVAAAVGLAALGGRRIRLWASLLAVGFLAAALWGRTSLTAGEMTFAALDVGQGQCLLLESGGFTAVVDCGGSYPEEAGETAARTLLSAGLTRVDALVLTHYDLDHAGGAVQLLHRLAVDRLYLPAAPEDDPTARAVAEAAQARGVQVLRVTEETRVAFDGGSLRLLPPPGEEDNDGLSILASVGEYDMLITGDLPRDSELALLSRYALPQAELLVAEHHGAATSTSWALLNRVRPESVVISVGADNPYGHPSPETLERLTAAGAAVYRTDQLGTIFFRR